LQEINVAEQTATATSKANVGRDRRAVISVFSYKGWG